MKLYQALKAIYFDTSKAPRDWCKGALLIEGNLVMTDGFRLYTTKYAGPDGFIPLADVKRIIKNKLTEFILDSIPNDIQDGNKALILSTINSSEYMEQFYLSADANLIGFVETIDTLGYIGVAINENRLSCDGTLYSYNGVWQDGDNPIYASYDLTRNGNTSALTRTLSIEFLLDVLKRSRIFQVCNDLGNGPTSFKTDVAQYFIMPRRGGADAVLYKSAVVSYTRQTHWSGRKFEPWEKKVFRNQLKEYVR